MDASNETGDVSSDESGGWAKSKAVLRAGLLSGDIPFNMKPKAAFNLNAEIHHQYKGSYRAWSDNFRNLKASVKRDRARMSDDVSAYAHDLKIAEQFQSNKPKFHRSAAFRLLKQDIDNELHRQMSPIDLWHTRPEYHQVFGLEEFRKHIYQEVDSRPKRDLRFERKKITWKYPEVHADHPRLQGSVEEEED